MPSKKDIICNREEHKMIDYSKLRVILKERGITWKELHEQCGVAENTILSLSQNRIVKTNLIDKVCACLQVQPGDIMEWIPDEVKDIEAQIADLQRKLDDLKGDKGKGREGVAKCRRTKKK
jgi:DNA-binding Xre family transcriptional regulator